MHKHHQLKCQLPMLFSLLAGVTATGCIPPHMDTPSAIDHRKNQTAIKPKLGKNKMDDLLGQASKVDVDRDTDEHTLQSSLQISSPSVTPDATCAVLRDCPKNEPDIANQKAQKFENRFLQQPTSKYIDNPSHEKKFTTSKGLAINHRRRKTDHEEIHAVDVSAMRTNTNRTIQLVELGKTVFIQSDRSDDIQVGNMALLNMAQNNMMLAQHFRSTQSLEMLQEGCHHSIQSLNYVGADFTT